MQRQDVHAGNPCAQWSNQDPVVDRLPGFFVDGETMNAYDNCLQNMYGLRRFGIKLGLDVIRTILENLGNPQNNFKTIHVAGTNGKGSVSATLASILREAGYSVGLYTSPHLVRFNERICINGDPIADADVIAAYEAVQAANRADREPTFFEFATAMALHHFGRSQVDWAVIETGMGGRLDATNMLAPEVTVITNISLEHRSYLGETIAAIAYEKAGIIKPGVPVVTGARQRAAIHEIEKKAKKQKAPVIRKGQDFRVRRTAGGGFNYYGIANRWQDLKTRLPGDHQIENAALSLAVCERLIKTGVPLTIEHIRRGIDNTRWPGRLEVVLDSPQVILDGAHNIMAARNLARYLTEHLSKQRLTLVVGVLDDKPVDTMLSALLPLCHRVIITQAEIDRAIPADELGRRARKWASRVTVIPDVAQAVQTAVRETAPEDAVCVAGSLYVVGEAIPALSDIRDITGYSTRTAD